jgi:hypothetical protein
MLTLTDFLTISGATAITVALVSLIRAAWTRAPEPWVTWGAAEFTAFAGGLIQGHWSLSEVVLLFMSGIVVATTALGSRFGLQQARVAKGPAA